MFQGQVPPTENPSGLALVSAPWPLLNRPSIQLGVLKAYLKLHQPGLAVKALHPYLDLARAIGYPVYQAISEKTWLAETIYGALLYPDLHSRANNLFQREAINHPLLKNIGFDDLTSVAGRAAREFIGRPMWAGLKIAGFSVCLCQMTASLYFIRRLKKKYPQLTIVIGGSTFAHDSVRELLDVFQEIDYAVQGEGEVPLTALVSHLLTAGPKDIPAIPGVVAQKARPARDNENFSQIRDLTLLPPPDFDDYFQEVKKLPPDKAFFPVLTAEISRGCWWHQGTIRGGKSGCAFCNLNRQWQGYRTKKPDQVVREIDTLTSRYQVLKVNFTDNLLPVKESGEIFSRLAKLDKDLEIFGELRANTPGGLLETMAGAGLKEVQIGLEALSTSLLQKMNKGTTAIENLEIMKTCEELGLINTGNLIVHFPGSDRRDVEETLDNLEFAQYFNPMKIARFWLGQGSPVHQNQKAFGLKASFNHPNYLALFPAEVLTVLKLPQKGYQGDLTAQKKLWRPVIAKVKLWQKNYQALHQKPNSQPILTYQDGRDFMIVRQRTPNNPPQTHRLTGQSRKIYLYCQKHRRLENIKGNFPNITVDQLELFLKMMVGKKLMFEERGNYLSLAVRVKRRF